MISELDETIRQLLIKEGGFDPAQVEVSFEIPDREWSAGISRPTLNCYLFDIRENQDLRQHGVQTERHGTNGAFRQRPLQRFDLTYLVTAWTRAVEDEHRLLWHALQTLVRFTSLPAEHLQGTLREHETPVYARTALPDGVLKSPGEFWTALENQLKPSLSYVVTLALSREALPAGPPVLTTRLRFAAPSSVDERWVWFGGTVRDDDGRPVGGATVVVEGRGLQTMSDGEGRFRLRVPGPGRYTLLAQAGAFAQRHDVDIPDMSYDIALGATAH